MSIPTVGMTEYANTLIKRHRIIYVCGIKDLKHMTYEECSKFIQNYKDKPTHRMIDYAGKIKRSLDLDVDLSSMTFKEMSSFINKHKFSYELPSAAMCKVLCAGSDDDFIALGPEED